MQRVPKSGHKLLLIKHFRKHLPLSDDGSEANEWHEPMVSQCKSPKQFLICVLESLVFADSFTHSIQHGNRAGAGS